MKSNLSKPLSKSDQAAATRRRLVDVARSLFAERGYAAVGLADIVDHVGMTKGALYHHFGSKLDLFKAVISQVQEEVADRVAAAAEAHPDPWSQLLAGCRAFLQASGDPVAQRIMLVDGPAVLGWSEWRALDESTSQQHLTEAIAELIDTGVFTPRPVEPLVHLLSGAMNEAALWLANSPDGGDVDDTMASLTVMLRALRNPE